MSSTNQSKEMTKANGNKKTGSDDIREIINLFHRRLQFGEVIKNPIDYLKALKPELRAAASELKFLQLAVSDKKSPYGWRPTPYLMKLMAERRSNKKSRRLYEADAMWWGLLSDYAFGYRNGAGKGSVFTRELLLALGLLREYDGLEWVTENLHILFDNGYCNKREKDDLPPFEHRPIRISAYGRALLRQLESHSQ